MKPFFSLVMCCLLVTLFAACVHADSANDFLNTGNNLLKNNDYAGALDAYEQGIQLNSTNIALWNGKAYVLLKLNRYTEALDAVK